MQTITSVGGELWIDNNDLLQDLSPLENIGSIGESSILGSSLFIINNDALTSLEGLGNIAPASILDLNIYNNPQLSECAVSSICDYLIDPNGTVDIHDNAEGCDNQDQVYLACWSSDKEIPSDGVSFQIYPNPCSGAAHLKISNINLWDPFGKQQRIKLEVFTISGVMIKELMNEEMAPGTHEVEIDLRDLPAGVYYCVLRTTSGMTTNKLIKL